MGAAWRAEGARFVSEWVICKKCGLKYRAREATCPRCEDPTDEGQTRWSEDKVPPSAPVASAFWIALPVGLAFALLGGLVFALPLGGRAMGDVTLACVVGGLLLLGVSWAWTATIAFREGLGWLLLAIFLPIVSVGLLKKWKALAAEVLGVGAIVLGVVVFAPVKGLPDDIARLCESRAAVEAQDCGCIGRKTAGLMTADDQKRPFNRDSPEMNELMLTAGQLGVKERLVRRCVSSKQGTEPLCLCITDKVLNAFTPAERQLVLDQVAAGAPPEKYTAMRADCVKR